MNEAKEVFENRGEGWEVKKIGECIQQVRYTTKVRKREFLVEGNYPIISQEQDDINGYWNNPEDLFQISNPVVIFGDHTKIIKYIDFDFVIGADGVKILQPIRDIIPKYFYYALKNIKLQNLGYARHFKILKDELITFPKLISEQKRIVQKLDSLFTETQNLEAIYQQKLDNLEELKQTILQKAFNGELT